MSDEQMAGMPENSQPGTDALVAALGSDSEMYRSRALALLSASYCEDDRVYPAVVSGWEEHGYDEAFPDFPMVSHFPIPSGQVAGCIDLAARSAASGPLKSKRVRCAGKLLEQLVLHPVAMLKEHADAIEKAAESAKIFFRVHPERLRTRIEMSGQTLESLTQQLDSAVAELTETPEADAAWLQGRFALEALRGHHPDAIDMAAAIRLSQPLSAPNPSFWLALESLAMQPESGLEEHIAAHLHHPEEKVFTTAVEALVRAGTAEAAARLIHAISGAPSNNRTWIIRGLQRIRAVGLAEELRKLRAESNDQKIWMMLLVAELNQLESASAIHVAGDLSRLLVYSDEITVASMFLAHQICESEELATALKAYLLRTRSRLKQDIAETKNDARRQARKQRQKLAGDAVKRYRRN
ncbi:MAG TPA: hypothetical protein DDW52_02680 [Planctomycetaceae bacterium]|nr:hypothetical protein [Planctomycetaceae bacterium]